MDEFYNAEERNHGCKEVRELGLIGRAMLTIKELYDIVEDWIANED